jgi:hypothetical protein
MLGKFRRAAMLALALAFSLALVSCGGKDEAALGSWSESGDTFSNKWSKIQFNLPSGFRRATDAELDELSVSTQAFTESIGSDSAAAARVSYDMIALKDPETVPQVMLLYENLGSSKESDSTETYFAKMAQQFESMADSGVTYTESGSEKVKLAGYTWDSKTYVINENTNQQYLLTKKGPYMLSIVLTWSKDSQNAESLLNGFSALGK